MNMTNISLKDVRMAAENLAHKLAIPIEEISSNNILEHMGRGSKGTIAAHLREVKIEKVQAEKCDLYDLPVEFRSALANLVETRVQKAEQAILQEAKITTEAFLTVQTENETLTASLHSLNTELDILKEKSATTIRDLEQALATARGELSAADVLHQTVQQNKAQLEKLLEVAEEDLRETRGSLDRTRDRLTKETGRFIEALETLNQKIQTTEKQYASEAQRNRDLESRLEKATRMLEELQSAHTEAIIRATRAETILEEQTKPPRKTGQVRPKPK